MKVTCSSPLLRRPVPAVQPVGPSVAQCAPMCPNVPSLRGVWVVDRRPGGICQGRRCFGTRDIPAKSRHCCLRHPDLHAQRGPCLHLMPPGYLRALQERTFVPSSSTQSARMQNRKRQAVKSTLAAHLNLFNSACRPLSRRHLHLTTTTTSTSCAVNPDFFSFEHPGGNHFERARQRCPQPAEMPAHADHEMLTSGHPPLPRVPQLRAQEPTPRDCTDGTCQAF